MSIKEWGLRAPFVGPYVPKGKHSVCPKCGRVYKKEKQFCEDCGQKLNLVIGKVYK